MNLRSCIFSSLAIFGVATVASVAGADSHLVNLSARARVGVAPEVVIAGFVVADNTEQILVRAVGPGLVQYNVPGTLADPVLTVYDAANHIVGGNDDWNAVDAAVFQQVSAFPLTPGSKDAAVVLTLPAGSYTAVASGAGGTTGVALVEVYKVDLATGSRLINLSNRAYVGTGANIVIPGLVISAGGGTRRMLIRAAGPSLTQFGVTGVLADPQITLVDENGTPIAFNDNWASDEPQVLRAAFTSALAFPFDSSASLDAAMVRDLNAGLYTIKTAGTGDTSGVTLVEVYDLTPTGTPPSVSITATDPTADETGNNPATFTITRAGDLSQFLIVNYATSGTALNLFDYGFLTGRVALAAGQASTTVTIAPVPDVENEPLENVSLALAPGLGYTLGGATAASADITSVAGTLYVANLRPESGAASSTGYGTATLLLNAAHTMASISIAVSNLSSEQTTAYLRLGPPGQVGAYISGLPVGQSSGNIWTLLPTGIYSAADLYNALQTGLLYIGIETTNFPGGELRGSFIQSSGSQTFTPPPAPPSAPTAATTPAEAARFLMQATFGATASQIDAVQAQTFAAWIDAQMALPATLHLPASLADFAAHPEDGRNMGAAVGTRNRQTAWWGIALQAPDQLRQRVAFALSELFVVSDQNATINNNTDGAANYYDLLVNGAFGNYRQLLEQVSTSPIMGAYLSHLRNAKADPLTGALPDENYAREVMQLFSVGLVKLQPDGTLQLDTAGLPIATYDQTTITETAKVFTGWAFYNAAPTAQLFRRGPANFLQPMIQYPTYHDTGAKTIIGGVALPAGRTGEQDLADTLDTLFNHPNTGPFVARRLIQRLVTSNPSPAYVYRVAQVFANNGSGVRGDLGAVVRAILLDYEARSPAVASNPGFGKVREPMLRLSGLLRALNGTSADNRFEIANTSTSLGESPLQSPTVFNFFEPDYVYPGDLAAAGLYAPEFQILTDSAAISVPNELYRYIFGQPNGIVLPLTDLTPYSATTAQLADRLNLLLCAGRMSATTRDRIALAVTQLPAATSSADRARTAIYLTINSPDGGTEK